MGARYARLYSLTLDVWGCCCAGSLSTEGAKWRGSSPGEVVTSSVLSRIAISSRTLRNEASRSASEPVAATGSGSTQCTLRADS